MRPLKKRRTIRRYPLCGEGSAVTPRNAPKIIRETCVSEIHGSCKHTLPDGTTETDAGIVRELINALNI